MRGDRFGDGTDGQAQEEVGRESGCEYGWKGQR